MIKAKVTSFRTRLNTWFKFEGKIRNDSNVIAFTRNHTGADDVDNADAGTKNNMSLPGRGGGET